MSVRYRSSGGEKGLILDLPEGSEVHEFTPSWPQEAMTDGEIQGALDLPFAPGADTLFIINDMDRPTPTECVLSIMARRFPDILSGSILVATGAHRTTEPIDVVGRALIGGLYPFFAGRFFVHDSTADRTFFIGNTSRGTRVEINERILGFGAVVAIGSVEPHWFAGYTGGRKSLVPGIAAFETIRQNHRLALQEGVGPLRTRGNPLAEDLMEAARLVIERLGSEGGGKSTVSFVNTVGREDVIYALAVGGLDSPDALTHLVDTIYRKESPELDVVIAVASAPMDLTLYQAMKSFENLKPAMKPGGAYVLIAACPDGLGPPHFCETLALSGDRASLALRLGREYRLSDHKFVHPLAFIESGGTMAVVSENLTRDGRTGTMGLFSCRGSIDEALSAVLDRRASRKGAGRPSVGIFIDAVNIVVA